MRRRRNQRGSVAVEFTVMIPVVVLILGVCVAGARLAWARGAVENATQAGARSASLAAGSEAAASAARTAVAENMSAVPCDGLRINPDVSGLAAGAGTHAVIRVDVNCRVPLSDLLLPGLPGSIQVTATKTAALDTYRKR